MGIDSEKNMKKLEIVNLNQLMLSVNGFSRKWISNQNSKSWWKNGFKSKIFQRKISNPKSKSGIWKNFGF